MATEKSSDDLDHVKEGETGGYALGEKEKNSLTINTSSHPDISKL